MTTSIDPTIPHRNAVVLRYVLERWELERPDQVFAMFADGGAWTFRELTDRVRRMATGLAQLGVKRGDRVMCWLPNGRELLAAWFGANWLGATYTPINLAYRGTILRHVIEVARPTVILCHSSLYERLQEVGLDPTISVILADTDDAPRGRSGRPLGMSALNVEIDPAALVLEEPIEPWDEQAILYTSGTTGLSKGVLSSYCHASTAALVAFEDVDAEDLRYLVTLPMFHAGGTIGTLGALLLGRSVVITERFETATFWDLVRRSQATCCTLLGAMATFLLKQPSTPEDRIHSLAWAYVLPHAEAARDFAYRFGIATRTMFNMTEISVPLLSELNPKDAASCGRARPGVALCIADAQDQPVQDGTVGELLIRPERPWSMSHGYAGDAEATAALWRNGWFHTGDLFYRSQNGEYYFVDRAKDAIRRRGENISSYEVEQECLSFPQIREVAAFGVPSEYGEDEVMVAVATVESAPLDHAVLIEHLRRRMPYYMVPRFIRVLPELPKTPTAKIIKADLRSAGTTPDTWDRETAGIIIKSDRLTS